jgi:hypothetical protein
VITRRGLLGGLAAALVPVKGKGKKPVGWTSQVARQVIIDGEANGDGLFVYRGAPASGNLADSIAAFPGTDDDGNGYPAGVASFGPTGTAQLDEGTVILTDPYGNSWSVLPFPQGSSSDPVYLTVITPTAQALFIDTNGLLYANQPGNPEVIETWHDMALLNGWVLNTDGFAQYKLMPDNTVAVRFAGVTPGTDADGTGLWAAPTGDVPGFGLTQSFPISVGYTAAPAYGSTPEVVFKTGQMQCFNLRGTIGSIAGSFRYPLD